MTTAQSVVIRTGYLLAGRTEGEDFSNRAVCAQVDLLLQKALLTTRHPVTGTVQKNSAWEVLSQHPPHYGSAAASVGTSFLAVGRTLTNTYPSNLRIAVHVYCPCTNAWIYISDLPATRIWNATALLAPTELLVIGGWNDGSQNSLYKGFLRFE